ncbi:MAG: MBL fold metallo-hydrolase [bacterium]|nr:MBL fold metallo-hydrolase [bacterium]
MKITKYVHSCLLVEDKGKRVLIDPGIYSTEHNALDVAYLEKIDVLLLTHEHQDHMDVSFVKLLAAKFPDIEIISNSSVVTLLGREGIKASSQGNDFISMEDTPHEKILGNQAVPRNTLFTLWGRFTHPGDSLSFERTSEILALPVQAPWGSFVQAMEKAVSLKPKLVVPIHDWHWRDEARISLYERSRVFLKEHGISFAALDTGQPFEA